MTIRIQRLSNSGPDDAPEVGVGADEQVIETTYDNQTFAWGPGQVRNFADDGVGKGHQAFSGGGQASIVMETGLFATSGESRA